MSRELLEKAAKAAVERERHGMNKSPEHRAWVHMRQRCTNPKKKEWPHYGGRGITVCDRWNSFEAFLEDMGPRPDGTSLDRINPKGNYELSNCRWADRKTQGENQSSTVYVSAFNERQSIADWAAKFGVSKETIRRRLSQGLPPEVAVSAKPVRGMRRTKLEARAAIDAARQS